MTYTPIIFLLFSLCLTLKLTIIHQGNIRGNYLPVKKDDDQWIPCEQSVINSTSCEGGIWHQAARIEQIRKESENVLTIQTGDFVQGTYLTMNGQGKVMFDFLDDLKYDLVVLGPRDFDNLDRNNSAEEFGQWIAIIIDRNYSLVMSNFDTSKVPQLQKISPYKIINFGDTRVGIISVTDSKKSDSLGYPAVASFSCQYSNKYWIDLNILPPLVGALYGAQKLEELGVQIKILVISDTQKFNLANTLGASIPGLDVIVVGDKASNDNDSYPVNGTAPDESTIPLISSGDNGRFLGRLDLEFDQYGNVISYTGNRIRLTSNYTTTPFVEKIRSIVMSAYDQYLKLENRVLGKTKEFLDANRSLVRVKESPIGNMVADSLREISGAPIAFVNGGIFFSSLNGTITSMDVYKAMPFLSDTVTIKISGFNMIWALQNSVSVVMDQNARHRGRFLSVSGIKFSWNNDSKKSISGLPDHPELRQRVVSVEILSSSDSFDLSNMYTVVLPSYMVSGGDDYWMFGKNDTTILKTDKTVQELVMAYISKHVEVNPQVEQRITVVDTLPVNWLLPQVPDTLDPKLLILIITTSSIGGLVILVIIAAVVYWKTNQVKLDIDLPMEWFWDISRVNTSNYTKSKTNPVIYYQQVNIKGNSRESEFFRELIGKLDFEELNVEEAYAVVSPTLALNMCGAWKIQQSRMQENPNQFCSTTWKQINDVELRERTIQYFLKRMNQWSWNENKKIEDSPVLPVVHGTSEFIAWKIASGGFATLSTLDSGYYGKGIYFSSSAFYTLPYIINRKDPTILICLTIPGNPCPVIEDPKGPNSFLGKPIMPGYQSNYIVVKKNGLPFTLDNYHSNKKPYDELVIDQEAQIVPIFLVKVSIHYGNYLSGLMNSDSSLPVIPTQVSLDQIPLETHFLLEGKQRMDYSSFSVV